MVKKSQTKSANDSTAPDAGAPRSVKDSAQQIWQAGLAAFTRAQSEGNKAFESLLKEGVEIQRRTQSAAEEKIAKATIKVSGIASEISSKASDQLGKVEAIFETSVAKALHKLGVPSDKDVKAIIARIDALTEAVQKLSHQTSPSTRRAAPAKRAAAKVPEAPVLVAKKRAVKKAQGKAAADQTS